MPWEHVTVIEKREEFVMLASQENANISQLCQRFGISRKTGYKWLNRFDGQKSTLTDQSRRPHHSPHKSPLNVEKAVIELRRRHPAWGGRKIAHVLARDQQLIVAPSTVTTILHRHQLIDPAASMAATAWTRFEHAEPNQLWQMDFKGHFSVADQRCHPLTVIDDHSRYNIVLAACQDEQRLTVQTILERTFARYGLPHRINTDNGSPWGAAGRDTLTGLAVWLIRLGVTLSYSRPLHPQTNGKDERFHRTLKAEVLTCHHFDNLPQVQNKFNRWRLIYNHQRPHEALSMQTPGQRYCPSQRCLPTVLPPIEYGPDDLIRKVQQGGWVSFRGYDIRVSKALVGYPIAFRPQANADGLYDLFFCHHHFNTLYLSDFDKL